MKFKIKSFKIGAGKPIVYMNKADAVKLNINIGDRVEVSINKRKSIGIVDVAESYFNPGELGASHLIISELKVKSGDRVELEIVPVPKSSLLLRKKAFCKEYTKKEIDLIIKDIVDDKLTEAEIAFFISGVYHCGMTEKETAYLTESIYKNGNIINWRSSKIADKHSIGGVPGNRTTPLVVSICASAGIKMPKTSSRAITTAAGTADVIESVADIDFPIAKLKRIVNKTNACLAWGGSLGLAPADDKLIQVEKIIHLDPESQLIASILAKKLAAGSKYVLIDIPYGEGAKVSKKGAKKLKKKFKNIAKHFKLKLETVLTDGSQPIGNGVGPLLEIKDLLRVLSRNNPPKDLEDKAIKLAAIILEMIGKTKKGKGQKLAREILDSGKALKKFEQIIKAQNGSLKNLKRAKFVKRIESKSSGNVRKIRNQEINHLARLAGSPVNKAAGLFLHVHKGQKIKKGQILIEIHAESKDKLNQAIRFFKSSEAIEIK
ncbi:thymidine phosphorylase [Candidatus Pacearchaeota archaeon]|uniref:AMP phosphorylase n=1 Tax=uncultured Candidatus Pacearchaeota archaeon TaxID=2109283 RepID=A0A447ITW7_9ARCH|nr:thymidine phosphorylase [Candidatus Pacearchaeota archaeon]OIO42324.1 MAG: hypothetical protein AUJ63_03550 [Candidatus Pacearchaeota archaeon CG1_02_35_32]VDS10960.1 AMP phosphorylase [uncultured Candidatus Pacearchaeota archaeon]